MDKNKYKDKDQQRSAYHKDGAQSDHPSASIELLDFAGQWQRQRQTQRNYENNDLRYIASHKRGEREPTHMHYASIVFSNQTVFLNCNYKYKDPCMVPLHSSHSKCTFKHLTPWVSAYDFWSSRPPTYTNACYVKQLKSDIWGIPGTAKRNLPRKPKNKTYYMKHTKPNLSDQNLPIQTYYTKPSKVDLWTFNLDPLSQFTLGYEVTELWFWDLTTCVTMWVLHNV